MEVEESSREALWVEVVVDMGRWGEAKRSARGGLVAAALCPAWVQRAMIVRATRLLKASEVTEEPPMDIA